MAARAPVLRLLPGRLGVARLEGGAPIPAWADGAGVVSITRRAGELSIVCAEARIPAEVRVQRGWRALEVAGPLDFQETGILASIAAPLAAAGISLFAVATFDTDLVLVREATLSRAVEALRQAGCQVQ